MNIKININKQTLTKEYLQPTLLSTVFSDWGIHHDLPCGGNGSCGKCKVIASGELSPMNEQEKELLNEKEIELGIRLSCMAQAVGDCCIELYDAAELINIVVQGYMPEFKKSPLGKKYGIAVDIGTTTVAAYLYDLSTYSLKEQLCAKNPQTAFGADVISRIQKSIEGEGEILQQSITGCINILINRFISMKSVSREEIDSMVITGNTAMLYLLGNYDVRSIATAPFAQDRVFGESVAAKDLGIDLDTKIYLPRSISAYVGSDITTAMLSSELTASNEPCVLIDIGTNGEMALFADNKLVCCSTAAGPAFEGTGLTMGMNALPGAISKVYVSEGKICYHTIDNIPPKGLCGSGILDAMSVLLTNGIIDETGCMLEEDHNYTNSIVETDAGIAYQFDDSEILITESDIRAIQLAKSAICAGIYTLMHETGISINDISKVYLAGGFGSYIDCENAEKIGLIPPGFAKKAYSIGNAAGIGASMILLSKKMLLRSQEIALKANSIELSTNPYFMEKYIDCMMF